MTVTETPTDGKIRFTLNQEEVGRYEYYLKVSAVGGETKVTE